MIIFTATLSLMITVVVALAGVATSSGSIHSLGGHVVLSGHELSSLSAGKLFPSPIVVRIAGLLGWVQHAAQRLHLAPDLPRIAAGRAAAAVAHCPGVRSRYRASSRQ